MEDKQIYIIGDVHGCIDELKELITKYGFEIDGDIIKDTPKSENIGLILAGDGSEIYIATFGNGIELITDGISLASNAQVKLTATVFADVALRHNAAFAKITDATLA